MAKWLDKYEQGGLVLKKKTKDNYGKKPNVNDAKVSAGPGFEGDGYTAQNWKSPAWGGQFQDGGSIPSDKKSQQFYNTLKDYYSASDRTEAEKAQYAAFQRLNEAHGYAPVVVKERTIAGKRSMINPFSGRLNIVAEADPEVGEIKSTPQKLMDQYIAEYSHYQQYNQNPEESRLKKTGRFLGHMAKDFGQMFKNTKGLKFGEAYEKNYVTPGTTEYEAHQVIQPKLQNEWANYYGQEWTKNRGRLQMGGALPGAVGFTYARTINPAPANGKYTKKTLASAQNGQEMKYYQDGLDFKPKSISKKGKKIIKDDMGQWAHPGEVTEIGSPDITMQGVDYPVLGISDTGDTQMMYPDQDYKFDGDKVTEFPMMEKGGWLDKYKAQSGKTAAPYGSLQGDLPEVVVTSTKPSKWGKFKFAPYDPSKNPESISQWNPKPGEREALAAAEQARRDEENSFYNNKHFKSLRNSAFADWRPYALAGGITALPAVSSALGLGSTGAALATPIAGVPGLTGANVMNAAFAYQAAKNLPNVASSIKTAYQNPTLGNLGNAALETGLTTLDALPFASSVAPGVKAAISASKESGLLSNAYKVNPFAFKPKSDAYYRMVGEGGYADALESGVVRPPVGSGHTEAYYNKGYPLDTRLRDATGRAGYGGPYMAEVKGDPELFVNENVANYTGPMFADPVVYSKQNIPINNPNLKFYKEDWLRGYKEVPKPAGNEIVAKGFIPKDIKDLFGSAWSLYKERRGEQYMGDKNRAAIKEGNEWFQNWIDDPLTKNKIKNQIIDQQLLGKRAPLVSDRINSPMTKMDWNYLTNYKSASSEYPLADQKKDFINLLLGKQTPAIHIDNYGVSYRHGMNPLLDMDTYVPGSRTSGPGTWISRSLDIPQSQRTSTAIHENTHDWLRDEAMERLGYKDLVLKNINQDAATNWADFSIHRDVRKNPIGYLADPTEVHARIMEARKHFGLTPGEYVTEERAKDIIERIGKGRSPISRRFPEIFDNPKQTAYLFNRLPAVAPVAVGVGAGALATQAGSDKQKNGGWLDKYK